MAKTTLSFLIGVGIASAFWSLTLWPTDAKERWILPMMATIVLALLVIGTIIWHWDD